MSQQDAYIIEVSQQSFDSYVIQNSNKLPVFVLFMGISSEQCFVMADTLAALATEFAGQFIFAKVDVNEQSELQKDYNVEVEPTLKVFKDGLVSTTTEGLVEEGAFRQMLKSFGIYHQSDELRLQAREKHLGGATIEAIQLLTKAMQEDPGNVRVAMDMVQVMIDIGEVEQATGLFNRLPERDKESEFGRSLIGQITFLELASKTEGLEKLLARLSANPMDQDARFDLAICFVAAHEYSQAADSLIEIIEVEPGYKNGAAREMLATLSNMLAANDPELSKELRQRLGNQLS